MCASAVASIIQTFRSLSNSAPGISFTAARVSHHSS